MRGGGDDESGEVVGGVAPDAASDAGLAGDILRVAMSGRIVCGSGIVGRRGRMGAEKTGLGGLVGGDLAGDGDAIGGGRATRPTDVAGGVRTEISSSSITSSIEELRVIMLILSSKCSLPVRVEGPLWPTWLVLVDSKSSSMDALPSSVAVGM